MQSDLYERCNAAAETLAVPAFPLAAIRARVAQAPRATIRKRPWAALVAAPLVMLAIAATAAIVSQSHLRFTRSGGMVIQAKHSINIAMPSQAQIANAAAKMNFHVTLPAALPAGSRPAKLFVGGKDIMAIGYDLPGVLLDSHHSTWIFLMSPNAIATKVPQMKYALRQDHHMSSARWMVGDEQVILVSNEFTPGEVAHIKAAMGGR